MSWELCENSPSLLGFRQAGGKTPSIFFVLFRIVSSFFVRFRLWSFLDRRQGKSDVLSATSVFLGELSEVIPVNGERAAAACVR